MGQSLGRSVGPMLCLRIMWYGRRWSSPALLFPPLVLSAVPRCVCISIQYGHLLSPEIPLDSYIWRRVSKVSRKLSDMNRYYFKFWLFYRQIKLYKWAIDLFRLKDLNTISYLKRTIVLVRSNVGEITYDGLWSNGPAWSASPQSEVSIMVFEPSTKK